MMTLANESPQPAVATQGQGTLNFLELALGLAARGWYVFPIKPDTKKPQIRWKTGATRDPEQIKIWARKWPTHRVGIACGPSGLFVVDLDYKPAKGVDGFKPWLELCAKHGGCPPTYTIATPSGGAHLYFSTGTRLKTTNGSNGGIAPGVDTRGEGGLVVAYDVVAIDAPIAPAPAWLRDRLMRTATFVEIAPDAEVPQHVVPESLRRLPTRAEVETFMAQASPQVAHDARCLLITGKPWGEPQGRDSSLHKLAYAFMCTCPWASPELIAASAPVIASCAAVEAEDKQATTPDWVARKLREKIPAAARYAADRAHSLSIVSRLRGAK